MSAKDNAIAEWNEIRKRHPNFARAFLAQQAILLEASESSREVIEAGMSKLLELGVAFPFMEYWAERCRKGAPDPRSPES